MKLESIKNEKFALTKNDMGSLVGGLTYKEETGSGSRQQHTPWSGVTTFSWSSDCTATTVNDAGSITNISSVYHPADTDAAIKDPCQTALK
ncbi:MAG: hypothetical protein LBV74_20765 [Tannerella sp.]|nr:hypothetical protein [Tannerella sp.]